MVGCDFDADQKSAAIQIIAIVHTPSCYAHDQWLICSCEIRELSSQLLSTDNFCSLVEAL